jgi:outer membrane protein assembly factor BamB
MAGTLSVASTPVLSAKVGVVYSGEVGRSAVYSRYNNGPRALPWGAPVLTGESSVYSFQLLGGNVSAMQIGF